MQTFSTSPKAKSDWPKYGPELWIEMGIASLVLSLSFFFFSFFIGDSFSTFVEEICGCQDVKLLMSFHRHECTTYLLIGVIYI